ncbi:MAG: hypothetical protein U0229_00220 [Anaeromyxobacter sp.]
MTPAPAPLRVENAAGLSLELDPDGGIRRIQHRDDVVNLFLGNGLEPSPANLWLRQRRGPGVEVTPLLGPRSPLRPASAKGGGPATFSASGEWEGLRVDLSLALAPDLAAWCWQLRLENRSRDDRVIDVVHAQDVGLASHGALRLNEFYVAQYVDLTPLAHPRCGWVVAARQNQPQAAPGARAGRFPWAVLGSLRCGVSYATDALQVFGLDVRMGGEPAGVRLGLPGVRLQHEHAMAAVQDQAVTLAPGATWTGGFFGLALADHPAATTAADLPAVDRALAWASALAMPALDAEPGAPPNPRTLFAAAPVLPCHDLTEGELRRLFGAAWRHEERDGHGLLSFFTGEQSHVVLRAKEARTMRPHGHLLRTNRARVPEEAALTSTAWMAGTFHSMVTQGHVSINRLSSTVRSYLGLFRSQGLRLFVQVGGRWQLLGTPSAFEMRPDACRWVYRHAGGALEVVSAARPDEHVLTLRARVLEGPPVAWLATLHLALGGDDGNAAVPVPFQREGDDVIVPVPAGSELAARFPGGAFRVAGLGDTALTELQGDARLFTDGRSRGLPFLCLEGPASGCFGFELTGELVPDLALPPEPIPVPELRPAGDGAAARELRRLSELLPWLLDDALVHYLSPRGLEQYSGGGWGTRDVSQGPLELLLALDGAEAARDLLKRVFAAQNADGDWPQWFQFFERERDIRAGDSHGDIVFWPVLAVARHLLAGGDRSLLDVRVPFHPGTGAPEPLLAHLDRALELIARRRVKGTALAAYGHGDWNDALQPADPSLREDMCSAWTVTLHHQTLTTLARALRHAGLEKRAAALDAEAATVKEAFRAKLMPDGVVAGYAHFAPGAPPRYLLHPRDGETGVHYSLLPMMHAILEDLLTPEEAKAHLALMKEHLWAPDGARLFDRPVAYRGGPMRLFQRVETATFFGREIGVMYTHAHLRYAQMLAHVGDGRGLVEALALTNPIGVRERLPQATLRQANCYYSSSDAAFRDRYEALEQYGRVKDGSVALDGGWRVYSSGPGISLAIVVGSLLGLRLEGATLVVDPCLPRDLDGLVAETTLLGRRVKVEYRVDVQGYAPRALTLNGKKLAFTRTQNPYRAGGAAVALADWRAAAAVDEPDVLRVELG